MRNAGRRRMIGPPRPLSALRETGEGKAAVFEAAGMRCHPGLRNRRGARLSRRALRTPAPRSPGNGAHSLTIISGMIYLSDKVFSFSRKTKEPVWTDEASSAPWQPCSRPDSPSPPRPAFPPGIAVLRPPRADPPNRPRANVRRRAGHDLSRRSSGFPVVQGPLSSGAGALRVPTPRRPGRSSLPPGRNTPSAPWQAACGKDDVPRRRAHFPMRNRRLHERLPRRAKPAPLFSRRQDAAASARPSPSRIFLFDNAFRRAIFPVIKKLVPRFVSTEVLCMNRRTFLRSMGALLAGTFLVSATSACVPYHDGRYHGSPPPPRPGFRPAPPPPQHRPAPRPPQGHPGPKPGPAPRPQQNRPAPRPQQNRPAPRPQQNRPAPRPQQNRPAPGQGARPPKDGRGPR